MTKADIFKKKASDIIKDSIKSVVYIDEKAWNPYEGDKYNSTINEHTISKKLYTEFKKQGINLNIHKFEKGDDSLPIESKLKKYLFDDIDLVLLDWDLDDIALNVSALTLLNDIITQSHIHFCCIYSATPSFDDIIKRILSFFSGLDYNQYDQIKALFEHNDDIINALNTVDITKKPAGSIVGQIMKHDNELLDKVTKITNLDKVSSLIPMAISVNKLLPKPQTALKYPIEIISVTGSEFTLTINNTIITILKKSQNSPKNFIRNFSEHIATDKNKSFLKLLGLDMQNQFSKYGAFLNPEILSISFNTFMHHRKQINNAGAKPTFEDFIKDLFIENSKLNLTNTNLKLLDDKFLDEFKVVKKDVSDNDLALINCFYNGAKIKGDRPINFGDVFFDEYSNSYYLCITALCDCVIRNGKSNTNFKYYFVKGSKIGIKEGFDKGDGGFVSYINESVCVNWAPGEYVKPFQFHIANPVIRSNNINILEWVEEYHLTIPLTYLFSLKQNYAQRIANYAFAHPIRVGVDFVKK